MTEPFGQEYLYAFFCHPTRSCMIPKKKWWINYDVLNYVFYRITSISVVQIVKKGDTEAIRGP